MTFSARLNIDLNEVHIWSLNLGLVPFQAMQEYESILSDDEKTRASKFRFSKDKKTFSLTRGVLRKLAGAYLDTEPKKVKFHYEQYGKPRFQDESRIKFNVSHSGDRAVIAFVRDYDIGVDIEYFKDDFDVLDIAENFFSRREIDKLKMQPLKEQRQAFYRCWTRKEAFIKAEGSGLSFPLDKFTVSMHSDNEANLEHTDWSPDEKDRWNMFSFKPAQNYIAAVAINGNTTSFNVFDWK